MHFITFITLGRLCAVNRACSKLPYADTVIVIWNVLNLAHKHTCSMNHVVMP